MATPSGQPFRPSHVIAAQRGKSPDNLRIVIDTGEVLTDRWSSEDDATRFLHALHLGMRGIDSIAGERDNVPLQLPDWATRENAEIVARATEKSGGTRARAADAYTRTLLGIGEPASIIDAAIIEECFWSALDDGREVLLLAGMPDPSHASTDDPILNKSPLARLAFAFLDMRKPGQPAVNLAERITFDVNRLSSHVTNIVTIGENGLVNLQSACRSCDNGVKYAHTDIPQPGIAQHAAMEPFTCTDCQGIASIALPRMSFSHCMLNDVLFADWVGWHGNPLIARLDGAGDEAPGGCHYDSSRADHRVIAERLAAHFDVNGWAVAAARVRSQL